MPASRPHRLTDLLRLPFKRGRLLWTADTGDAGLLASQYFMSHLAADIARSDGSTEHFDLGSGLVSNIGVMAMAYDWQWPAVAALGGAATLATQNFQATGIGVAGAATTDIQLGTPSAPTTVTAVTAVQSVTPAANAWTFKSVATVNYSSTLAITEWGLFSAATITGVTTGSPFTAGTAATGTVTATPLTASTSVLRGHTQLIVKDTTAATPFFGLVLSNSTSVFTVPAWYKVSDGTLSGLNPVNADVYDIRPVMWDRKQFAAINVNNLDSVQYTYSLLINSGG
jgi:hypothetical protein